MRKLRGLSRTARLAVLLAVGGAAFGIATAVQAAIPDSSGIAHGCYDLRNVGNGPGDLRLVDPTPCRSWERPIDLATPGLVAVNVRRFMVWGPPVDVSANDFGTADVNCPGYVDPNLHNIAISGGVEVDPGGQFAHKVLTIDSANQNTLINGGTTPSGAWRVEVFNEDVDTVPIRAYAVCVLSTTVVAGPGFAPVKNSPTRR